jgi:hypothetical protein
MFKHFPRQSYDRGEDGNTYCTVISHPKHLIPILMAILILTFFNIKQTSSVSSLLQFVCVGCGIMLISQFVLTDNYPNRKIYSSAIAWTGVVQVIYVIFQCFQIDPIIDLLTKRQMLVGGKFIPLSQVTEWLAPYGSLGNPMVSGGLLAVTFPFILGHRYLKFALPLFAVTMYYLNSALLVISVAVSMLPFIWFTFPKIRKIFIWCLALVPPTLLLITKFSTYYSAGDRWVVWEKVLGFVWNPIYGVGVGAFRDNFANYCKKIGYSIANGHPWVQAHNEFLETYVVWGVVGLIVLAFLLSRIDWKDENKYFIMSFVAIMTNSIGGFPWHISSIALIGIICYSMIIKKEIYHEELPVTVINCVIQFIKLKFKRHTQTLSAL